MSTFMKSLFLSRAKAQRTYIETGTFLAYRARRIGAFDPNRMCEISTAYIT